MKAVIYCRVSSEKQVREGHGLEGQEKRCRDYADIKGYEVIKVFRDEGVSGGLTNRPAMQALIKYIQDMKFPEIVVIFDDIKRFARNIEGHFELKAMLISQGAILESPSHTFEDTPGGKLVETIFASVAEFERNTNKIQVCNRMLSRIQLGYWVFYPPTGYKYIKHPVEGKIIEPIEPMASIMKEAMEGFASGILHSQEDVRLFLIQKKFPCKGKTVYLEMVKRILTRSLYAGIIDYPKWGIKPMPGRHKALVSIDTFNKIQERLFGRAKHAFSRKSDHEDFPIRGLALCPCCEKPYTSSWSQGRNAKFPYYRCNNKRCNLGQKSIRKEVLEELFSNTLKEISPAAQIVNLTKAITTDVYNKKMEQKDIHLAELQKEIRKLDKEIKSIADKFIQTSKRALQQALENKIDELETNKQDILRAIESLSNHHIDFGTTLNRVMSFIENPCQVWASGDLKQKKLVQRLVFMNPIVIHPSQPIGTANLSFPFKMLRDISDGKIRMVEAAGIEPASASPLPLALHA